MIYSMTTFSVQFQGKYPCKDSFPINHPIIPSITLALWPRVGTNLAPDGEAVRGERVGGDIKAIAFMSFICLRD